MVVSLNSRLESSKEEEEMEPNALPANADSARSVPTMGSFMAAVRIPATNLVFFLTTLKPFLPYCSQAELSDTQSLPPALTEKPNPPVFGATPANKKRESSLNS